MYNGFIVLDNMRNSKAYDGKTDKFGIDVNGVSYIVKFKNETVSSLYSEHIASQFISSLGLNCHETWLGVYNKELVVIMRDFTADNAKLRSYGSTKQSSEGTDVEDKLYTYDDVIYMIRKHTKMSELNKERAIIQFWDTFICDAILGNRDRHRGNWGYLTYRDGYRPSPIYDNGGSLFPDVENKIDEYRECLLNNKELKFIADRAERFPASLFQMKRQDGSIKRTNYYEMFSDLRINKTFAREVRQIKDKIGFDGIYDRIINILGSVSSIVPYEYRRFYLMITCVRYLHIIERKTISEAYNKVRRRLLYETRCW